MKPILSIITVIYNSAEDIEKTIRSVAVQLNEQIEFIIIDGGSTDGSLEIVKKYAKLVSYWVSEQDNGIYDAMNKGISKASGTYIYFINAGDELINLPLEILTNLNHQVICFPVKLSSHEIRYPQFNGTIKTRNTLPHQGCFYKKTDNLKYNLKYRVFADFDLNQKLFKAKISSAIFTEPIVALHAINGVSHNKSYLNEIFDVVEGNFGMYYRYLSKFYFKYYGIKQRLKKLKLL